jgi:hypothetical protein
MLDPSRQMLQLLLLLHRVCSRLAALISASTGQHSSCFVSVVLVKFRPGVLRAYVCLFVARSPASPSLKDVPV